MVAIGCLLPIMLMIAAGVLGAALGGGASADIWWGIGGGFLLGAIGMAALLFGYERITGR